MVENPDKLNLKYLETETPAKTFCGPNQADYQNILAIVLL